MYTDIQAIVLAAGKSTRFNTGKTKLLEKICGQEMILYITKLLQQCNIPTTLVVGHQKRGSHLMYLRTSSVNHQIYYPGRATGDRACPQVHTTLLGYCRYSRVEW